MGILWALTGCAMFGVGNDLERDLQVVCTVATKVDQEGGGDKAAKLGRKVAKAKLGPGAKALWKAVQAAPPKARVEVLDRLLQEQGVHEFSCPPLRRLLLEG